MAQAKPATDAGKYSQAQTGKPGAFVRPETKFHSRISCEKDAEFPAVKGRYHLYVSLACPWAHRCLITLALKGIGEDVISRSIVEPYLQNIRTPEYKGWAFNEKYPDPLHKDFTHVYDLYKKSIPDYPNKSLSVPILWDKKTEKIINNESAQIIEMFNSEFNEFAKNPDLDLNPKELQEKRQEVDDFVYPCINDGVYRCGLSRTQEAYEAAYKALFGALDKLEDMLSKSRYLCGDQFTLSDIRAFVTLLRFDPVYNIHFKCNKRRLSSYPNIWGYTREIYQMPGVADTCDIPHIKLHYYHSHRMLNPSGIVPVGPEIDYKEPHGRDAIKF